MNLSEILGCVVAVISIVSFLCVVIKWGIIDPLNKSIINLTTTVDDLKVLVANLQNSENSLDKRVTVLETVMEANGCNHLKQN
jgi:hypothetical protein